MRRSSPLPTLAAATEWLRDQWVPRETPDRLHTRDHDGWGLRFAPAFGRRLDSGPYDRDHDHPPRREPCECPWSYPTWRALHILSNRSLASWTTVLEFVINGYSVRAMTQRGIGEGELLRAIRSLFDCYERAPVRVAYTEKSESQRAAEAAA